jgi:hypothetical protein
LRCNKLGAILLGAATLLPLAAQDTPVHGLWVWKTASVLTPSGAAERLRDFCQSQGINEVYVAVPATGPSALASVVTLLHRSGIRISALLSSADADQTGRHRQKLLDRVREIVQFNGSHAERLDGMHLDIEPQQRPENKGPGNLGFLAGLVEAYREVRSLAEPARLTVDADIQEKLLKGSAAQRRMLLTCLPRLTLMLYELSSPEDGRSAEEKIEKLRATSQRFLQSAYEGIDQTNVARMVIALRTADYGETLPAMLQALDSANRGSPHYAGWARHSYNDILPAGR